MACVILVPWPGIDTVLPAMEAQDLNHWTTREVPYVTHFKCSLSKYIFAPWKSVIASNMQ